MDYVEVLAVFFMGVGFGGLAFYIYLLLVDYFE